LALDRSRKRALPSYRAGLGWVIAANTAADLAAWTRLLGCRDPDLNDADPDTLRPVTGSGTSPPGSAVTPASGA